MPGCDVRFDWSQSFVNAELSVALRSQSPRFSFSWSDYKQWDIGELSTMALSLNVDMTRWFCSPPHQELLPPFLGAS